MMKKILGKIKNFKNFIFISVVILGLPFFLNAVWWNPFSWFAGGGEIVINALIAIALFVPLLVSNLFLALAIAFFNVIVNQVIHPSYSYSGFDNPIISAGFPIVQNLGNIIIIMGILVVGLATILGIEEYRAQRKLPVLIICALLLNFSNVVCGFVIDISNVLTHHFLKDTTNFGKVFYENWKEEIKSFTNFDDFKTRLFGKPESSEKNTAMFAAKAITMIIYCFLSGLIIIIITFVFIVRDVAIPIFVVLAPAAVASYVMPKIPGLPESFWGHRGFFDWWLKQFLEWCFIGVTVAFFSYLANVFISTPAFSSELSNVSDISWFQAVSPYFGALFLLYLALQVGFQTSAFGAGAMIALGHRAGAALRGEVGKRVGAGARRLRTSVGERMAKSERLQKAKDWYKEKVPGWAKKTIEGTGRAAGAPIYAVRKAIGMATGFEYAGVFEESKKRFAEAKEKFKKEGADAKKLAQTILNPFMTLEDKAAAWSFAKETGQFGKVIGILREQNANPDKLLVRHIQSMAPINPDLAKLLVKMNPHLAEEIKQGLSKKTAEAIGLKDLTPEEREAKITLPMKILMQLSPEEFVSVNPEAQKHSIFKTYLSSPDVSVSQFRKFLEQGDPEAVADFKKYVKEQLGGWSHFERINNKPVWNWIKHSPAVHDLGILREGETETKKLITEPTEKAFKEAIEEAKRRGEKFG